MLELRLNMHIFLFLVCISFINCSFQISLFNQLIKKNKDINISISPLSIFQALSLVTNGARGETQDELLKLLDNKKMEELNSINLQILLLSKQFSSLEIANAIMTKLSPSMKFKNIAKDNYSAKIQPLRSVKQINKWCDKQTHGKIKNIIDELPENIFMVILNAIYFKGEWEIIFSKESTTKKLFYNFNSSNKGKYVDMMNKVEHYSYFKDSNLQAIELNFKKDFMSALILLPNSNININDFIAILDKDNEYIYTIIDNLKYSKVNIEMPKFEINYKESLKNIFMDMGVKLPFDNRADFSNIRAQNDLKIDDIIHKTYLKVYEDGTEAAAVTAIIMVEGAMEPIQEEIHNMIINRPFLFIIRNKKLPKNYDIIFISKIEELN